MSQPFFEEVEIDGMMSKNSCAEHTTSHQLLQQVCNTHKEGVIAGTGATGGKAFCAWAAGLYRWSVTNTLPFAPSALSNF